MDIEKSSLFREIQDVLASPAKPVHFTWRAEIHLGDIVIPCLKVVQIDDVREFDTCYAEVLMLEVLLGFGTFSYQVYPNQDKLDITLTRVPLMEVGASVSDGEQVQAERYTAVLVSTPNFAMEANGPNTPSQESLDRVDLRTFKFQLLNKTLEQLRLVSVGGPFRGGTVEEVVKLLLTNESQQVDVDALKKPKGVEMIPASNQAKRDHVIIPHGTPLVKVPEYIHEKCGGIYSAGLGYFYQNDYWYVYPCYDTTRYETETHTLTVVNVPKNKFPNVERTYRLDGTHLTVLATSEIKFSNDSTVQQLNLGNGARFADATTLISGKGIEVKDNKATISRARNTSEFTTTLRDNGINNVRRSNNPINANPYLEYSKLARRNGGFLEVVWERCNIALLFPGMMVKFLYLDGEEVKELHGSLLKIHNTDMLDGKGLTSTRYTSYAILVFFMEQPPEPVA